MCSKRRGIFVLIFKNVSKIAGKGGPGSYGLFRLILGGAMHLCTMFSSQNVLEIVDETGPRSLWTTFLDPLPGQENPLALKMMSLVRVWPCSIPASWVRIPLVKFMLSPLVVVVLAHKGEQHSKFGGD